jgi:hypothetical protein
MSERDIRLALRLDALLGRVEAVEAALGDLRSELAALAAEHATALDDVNRPNESVEWLGHEVVERAMALLHPISAADL